MTENVDAARCDQCAHAIFDPDFGEWKCLIYQHVVYEMGSVDALGGIDCMDYKAGKPGESKENRVRFG